MQVKLRVMALAWTVLAVAPLAPSAALAQWRSERGAADGYQADGHINVHPQPTNTMAHRSPDQRYDRGQGYYGGDRDRNPNGQAYSRQGYGTQGYGARGYGRGQDGRHDRGDHYRDYAGGAALGFALGATYADGGDAYPRSYGYEGGDYDRDAQAARAYAYDAPAPTPAPSYVYAPDYAYAEAPPVYQESYAGEAYESTTYSHSYTTYAPVAEPIYVDPPVCGCRY